MHSFTPNNISSQNTAEINLEMFAIQQIEGKTKHNCRLLEVVSIRVILNNSYAYVTVST